MSKSFFTCPDCGGHTFGTSTTSNWDEAVGHCHGMPGPPFRQVNCRFTWQRKDDSKLEFIDEEA